MSFTVLSLFLYSLPSFLAAALLKNFVAIGFNDFLQDPVIPIVVSIVIGLVALFFEIVKATRTGSGSLINHMLSLVVFILFLVEFLLVQGAATQIFFILMTIAFLDVIGGFVISIRTAGRDVSIGL